METLRKVLRLTDSEFTDSLNISHEEFITGFLKNTITYKLPNRFINIFYRIPNSSIEQILIQIFLIAMWGGIGFGIYFLIKKQWFIGLISFVSAFVLKKAANIIILNSIKRVLLKNKVFFENLVSYRIIGIYSTETS